MMVSQHGDPGRMVARLIPPSTAPQRMSLHTASSPAVIPVPPPWRFVVTAADGTELLVMREEGGRLVVEGDESRWDEGARRFLHGVMQWSGQAGITWKDEARRAAEK